MAKTKISEWSTTPASNTDIDGINIAEGCAPSGINDAIRDLMAQVRSWQSGATGDPFNGPVNGTVGATTPSTGAFTTLSASSTLSVTGVATLGAGAILNTPASVTLTNATGLPLTTGTTGTLATTKGGTGLTSFTANGVVYASSSSALATGSALVFDGTNTFTVGTSSTSGSNIVLNSGTTAGFGGAFKIQSGGTTKSTITSKTVVTGGGTDQSLWLGSEADNIYLSSAASTGNILFGQGPGYSFTEQMRLTSTGLGIGTSSPAYKLDVSGTIQATGSGGAKVRLADNTVSVLNSSAIASGYLSFKRADGTQKSAIGSYYNVADEGDLEFIGPTGSTNMLLNSSGNLGLGVTPSAWFTSNNLKAFQLGGGSLVSYLNNQVWLASNYYLNSSGADTYVGTGAANRLIMDGAYKFFTAPSGTAGNAITFTQAMTLDNSGNLLAGKTVSGQVLTAGFEYNNTANTQYLSICNTGGSNYPLYVSNKSGGGTNLVAFYSGSSLVGSIGYNGTVTLYNTTSDQRLKENIVDAPEFGNVIDAIQVRSYDWKASGNHQRAGFIAQELVTVAPEAVHQPEDTEQMMAVDYSKLVPMLVKEIQSLRVRLAVLEAK